MSPAHTPDWRHRAASLTIDARAFIGGKRFDALSGETFDVISPLNGKAIARAARCRADDVNAAVISARTAFDSGAWSSQPPAQRKRILLKWADKIIAARDELALLET
ncbi:MAG TPA: aldehyde dehydrogenase family protein, partial [Casimicrobium sp.]|nr:aldehyde dehydrogenase family protein [Casimicrobium sp.]